MGWQSKVHWNNIVIMPCFSAIGGQPIAEILQFNSFQMVGIRHLGFLKFEILTGFMANERHCVKFRGDGLNRFRVNRI